MLTECPVDHSVEDGMGWVGLVDGGAVERVPPPQDSERFEIFFFAIAALLSTVLVCGQAP